MKKFFAAVLLFITLSVSGSAQESCQLCSSTPWSYATVTIYLPGYPSCPISYDYSWRRCSDGEIEIHPSGFYFDNNDPNCSMLDSYVFPSSTPNFVAIEQIFRTGLDKAADALFMNWYNGLQPWDKHLGECDSAGGQQTYNLSIATCHGFYSTTAYDPTHGYPYSVVHYVMCNEESCCIKEVDICWNTSTNSMQRTETIIQQGTPEDCETDSPQVPSGVNPDYVSPCRVNCWEE